MALFATETWTMRHRLLLTIGAILVVCQLISVFWLWHESKEQIQLLVASAIEGHNNQKHVEHEVREAVASLLVPSLLIVGLALYISMLAVRKITRPLSRLQSELENRTPDNLTPIVLSESVPEVTAVTTALNQLVSRLNLTLDRERLSMRTKALLSSPLFASSIPGPSSSTAITGIRPAFTDTRIVDPSGL